MSGATLYISVFRPDPLFGGQTIESEVRAFGEPTMRALLKQQFLLALIGSAQTLPTGAAMAAVHQRAAQLRAEFETHDAAGDRSRLTCVSSAHLGYSKAVAVGPTQNIDTLLRELRPGDNELLAVMPGESALTLDWLQELVREWTESTARPNKVARDSADRSAISDERVAVLAVRRALLDRVASWNSEELAKQRGSFTSNASQLGADLRASRRIFGVRAGKEWRYPAFQFEGRAQPKAALPEVLAALGDDPQGWDTLQWFLTPHESLTTRQSGDRDQLNTGRPIDLLNVDPDAVIAAAKSSHWRARD